MSAWHPMSLTRAWPNAAAVDDFDRWQHERHLPDLMALRGAVAVGYYRIRMAGLPQAWQGTGNRMAVYSARDLDGLRAWVTDPGVAEAVADGSRFFPTFNELDGDVYTGNVYEVTAATGDDAPEGAPVVVERFEVDAHHVDRFDDWLTSEAIPSTAAAPGVLRVRAGRAIREDFPVPYYNSAGNRLLTYELAPDDPAATLAHPEHDARLAGSQAWDRRLAYVRRDVYEHVETVRSAHGGSY